MITGSVDREAVILGVGRDEGGRFREARTNFPNEERRHHGDRAAGHVICSQ